MDPDRNHLTSSSPSPSPSPFTFATFGELLKYLRRREHLTQFELSTIVGYSESQISRLEQNQRLPDLAALKALFIPALHLDDDPQLTRRFLDLAQQARQNEAPTPGIAPYKGLQYFDEPDAELFFGREALISRLAGHIMDLAQGESPRFLAVVGASGSGKSSLVRAGLSVALKHAGWDVFVFTPTAHPLRMLEDSLHSIRASVSERVLLIVDQFEEVFTMCRDELERIDFIEGLLAVSRAPSKKTSVVITLRADFYSHCAQYPTLRQAVAADQEYIGQMNADELRRAIEEPAKRGGWQLEPGLVDVLLNDIGAISSKEPEPGALPLLSHALLSTWGRRQGATFTLEGYYASGGVRGAIAETAESVYVDQLNQVQQEIARQVFLRLTELGEGTEDTRRRATLNELAHQSEETFALRTVLNMLADARLITLNEDTAEVAHEALIREWQRLRQWLLQDREGLRLHRHLTDSARDWETRGQDAAELYRGARLAQASEWISANPGRLNAAEQAFISASLEQEQYDAMEREAARQRELKAAQDLAETESKRAAEQSTAARRLRQRAIFLAGTALVAVLLAGTAILIAIVANNNSHLSRAHQLASDAEAALPVDSGQSIYLALQSLQIHPEVGTYSLLHRALFASHLRSSVQALQSDADYIAIDPAADLLATSGGDPGVVTVWRVKYGVIDPTALLTLKDLGGGCKGITSTDLMFSPDGNSLAISYCDTYISLVDSHTGKLIQKITPDWKDTTGLTFSPNGRWLAAFSAEGQITIWDAQNGQNLLTFVAYKTDEGAYSMTCLDFSPDGRWLATGGSNGQVKIWSLDDGINGLQANFYTQIVQKNEDDVQSIRFSPDGRKLADATLRAIHILDLSHLDSITTYPELVRIPLKNNQVRMNSLDFTPDGDHLISAQLGSLTSNIGVNTLGNGIQIWDATTGLLLGSILPEEQLLAGVLSQDGQTYYSAHAGGVIHSWDISSLGSSEELAMTTAGNGDTPYLSPDGEQLLVMSQVDLEGGKYQFSWNSINRNQLVPLTSFTIDLGKHQFSVFVNKDLTRIIAIDQQNLCRIFDAASGKLLRTLQLGAPGPYGVTIVLTKDATSMIMETNYTDTDDLLEVWDTNNGNRLYKLHIPDSGFHTMFSTDEKEIVTYGGNHSLNLVRWWDPVTGQKIKEFDPQNGAIYGVVFTPDGKYLLSWGEDQTVKIYEAASARLLRALKPSAQINSVMLSPDSKTIAVSLSTIQTALYSFVDGHELVAVPGEPLNFVPGSQAIIDIIPGDPTAYAFTLNNNALVQIACQRLKNIATFNGDTFSSLKICQEVIQQ